jgi:hypothetical protein
VRFAPEWLLVRSTVEAETLLRKEASLIDRPR